MSSTQARSETATEAPRARGVDTMKLEVVVIPVANVDRAQAFYGGLGWRLDADFVVGDEFRVVRSHLQARRARSTSAPGSRRPCRARHRELYLVVSDIEAARAELVDRGVEVSELFHRAGPGKPPLTVRSNHRSYRSYASFGDPDGNGWLLQEVTARLPGRVDTDATTFTSSTELAAALRRAAAAHGEHEKRTGQHDADWPDWYAEYLVREQAGKPLPT